MAIDDIFNDPAAMIMDFSGPGALAKVWHLCDELASINGSSAMMRTSVNQEVWEEAVEKIFQDDPDSAITRIRWKKSISGEVWVQPMATRQQIDATTRYGKATRNREGTESVVKARLSQCAGGMTRDLIMEALAILKEGGLPLEEAGEGECGNANTWNIHRSASFGDCDGSFSLIMKNEVDAERAMNALKDFAMVSDGGMITISTFSDRVAMMQANNCSRRRQRNAQAAAEEREV